MAIYFDDKGKFFTDIVSKEPVSVIIQTITHRIQGLMHVRPGERLKDELNCSERFVAVTEATVFSGAGEVLYHSGFLAVNQEHIVWIIPNEDLANDQESGGG